MRFSIGFIQSCAYYEDDGCDGCEDVFGFDGLINYELLSQIIRICISRMIICGIEFRCYLTIYLVSGRLSSSYASYSSHENSILVVNGLLISI